LVLSDGPASSARKPPVLLQQPTANPPTTTTTTTAAKAFVARHRARAIPHFALYVLVAIVLLMMSLVALHSAIDT
jgi:hypothetical protein